jgi:preprotein translocase subunit YajC
MNRLLTSISAFLLMALPLAAQGKAPSSPTSFTGSVLPMMLVMFAIIYFLMIRPEQKKQKERLGMLKDLKKGDRVVALGGMFGVVGSVKDNSVMVKIAENTVVEFTKSSITNVLNNDGSEKTADSSKDEKEKK